MNFQLCKVTTSKADYGNRRIKIGFEMAYNDENEAIAERLAAYIGREAQPVEVRIIPIQPNLPLFQSAKLEIPPSTQPEDWQPATDDEGEEDV